MAAGKDSPKPEEKQRQPSTTLSVRRDSGSKSIWPWKKQTDGSASFLRAARAGNLDKVLEFLKTNTDINTCNANGLNALHLASKEGHVNVVVALLERNATVDSATKKGNTALHIASLAGQDEIVKVLVESGASVNIQSQNGFTPLYMAAQENHDSVVRFLLAHGANQSLATEDGFTPLAVALQQGHDRVVSVLLENDTRGKVRLPALHIAAKKDDAKAAALLLHTDHNPDITSKSGFTPLHIASHYGNDNIAALLIQRGADVNYVAKHQITPLHVASKWGKGNMVSLLLDKGANIEAKTRDGLTPLHCAARSGHEQVVDMLLEKGAPITAKTKNGLAPLHMASQGDHVDAARILLYHKAPVDDVTVDFLTALHVAAHCGHVRVAKLLLDRKADPNARALNGFTPLHIACKKNRIKVVELLLKHGASIEATTESGLTPLHVASFMGCMNIVIYLIQHGASADVPTVRGESPLHLAARANQTDIIRILLRNGAEVDAKAREQQTALHIASRLGNADIVGLLLQQGASVDAPTKDLYTPLHIAAKEGQEEVAGVLLDHGASLNTPTKKGFTPLHLAAKYGHLKVASLLLQRDAPVDPKGKNGVTPLHVAAHYDHQNVALLLLDKGAQPHATAKNGYTPLHIAARKNQMDIAGTLLEYGASANAESKAGFTPLHLSAQEGHTDMATLLLEHGGQPACAAKNGLTPLHLCSQEDRVPVAAILVKHGAVVDAQTKAGYTPLHVASHFGQMNMVRFLLQHGTQVDAATQLGYTPLHQAAQQGHTQIVNLLLENKAQPNMETNDGKTALSIAQRLGYISVVETLKVVTETRVTTNTTTTTEEKYKVVVPETMHETFMSESEDEGADDTMLGDQSYRYLTVDEMKSLGDDSLPIDYTKDENLDVSFQSNTAAGVPMDRISPQHKEMLYTQSYPADNVDVAKAPILAGPESLNTTMNTSFNPTEEDKHMILNEDESCASVPDREVTHTSHDSATVTHSKDSTLNYSGEALNGWDQFLVSFMVDARGGAMRGCRHSGVRVIIPPRKAAMPMRITCRYLKKDKLVHAPPLMEGEALASRILEMGPSGAKFLGPVIIEVPHFASLRGKEREIVILRSDNGETWREHTLEATEEAVQEVLNESFDGEELKQLEDLNTNRITRILTTDFPQYFAIVTRIRQEVHAIGPEGGMVSSTVVPQVQAVFPQGALTKKIKVGLQAQPISTELVAKLLGNRVAVSPIVTVEPRRRKFHKPITLTIPVPQAASKGMINQYSGEAPTLRLLCSITGGTTRAQWEDVTGSTPLTFVNDCVSFTTTVSARFWLMDCTNIPEATKMATELYREAIHVPFMAKFVVFSKRHAAEEARVRVFCMTDDKEDKTLETQEHFIEVAKSRDVEVLEGKTQYLEFAGNLIPVTKSGDQLAFNFYAFRENRLPFTVRVKDPNAESVGRVAFMRQPKVGRGDAPQSPICNLNLSLPDNIQPEPAPSEPDLLALEKKYAFLSISKTDTIHKADLRLSDISNMLAGDWVALAKEIDVSDSDINIIKSQYPDNIPQQAIVMLRLWMQTSGNKATGNTLEKALRTIHRDDIVDECICNLEEVTDDRERAMAKERLDRPLPFDETDLVKDSGSGHEVGGTHRIMEVPTDEAEGVNEMEIVPEPRSSTIHETSQVVVESFEKDRPEDIVQPVHVEEVTETKVEAVATHPVPAEEEPHKPSSESERGSDVEEVCPPEVVAASDEPRVHFNLEEKIIIPDEEPHSPVDYDDQVVPSVIETTPESLESQRQAHFYVEDDNTFLPSAPEEELLTEPRFSEEVQPSDETESRIQTSEVEHVHGTPQVVEDLIIQEEVVKAERQSKPEVTSNIPEESFRPGDRLMIREEDSDQEGDSEPEGFHKSESLLVHGETPRLEDLEIREDLSGSDGQFDEPIQTDVVFGKPPSYTDLEKANDLVQEYDPDVEPETQYVHDMPTAVPGEFSELGEAQKEPIIHFEERVMVTEDLIGMEHESIPLQETSESKPIMEMEHESLPPHETLIESKPIMEVEHESLLPQEILTESKPFMETEHESLPPQETLTDSKPLLEMEHESLPPQVVSTECKPLPEMEHEILPPQVVSTEYKPLPEMEHESLPPQVVSTEYKPLPEMEHESLPPQETLPESKPLLVAEPEFEITSEEHHILAEPTERGEPEFEITPEEHLFVIEPTQRGEPEIEIKTEEHHIVAEPEFEITPEDHHSIVEPTDRVETEFIAVTEDSRPDSQIIDELDEAATQERFTQPSGDGTQMVQGGTAPSDVKPLTQAAGPALTDAPPSDRAAGIGTSKIETKLMEPKEQEASLSNLSGLQQSASSNSPVHLKLQTDGFVYLQDHDIEDIDSSDNSEISERAPQEIIDSPRTRDFSQPLETLVESPLETLDENSHETQADSNILLRDVVAHSAHRPTTLQITSSSEADENELKTNDFGPTTGENEFRAKDSSYAVHLKNANKTEICSISKKAQSWAEERALSDPQEEGPSKNEVSSEEVPRTERSTRPSTRSTTILKVKVEKRPAGSYSSKDRSCSTQLKETVQYVPQSSMTSSSPSRSKKKPTVEDEVIDLMAEVKEATNQIKKEVRQLTDSDTPTPDTPTPLREFREFLNREEEQESERLPTITEMGKETDEDGGSSAVPGEIERDLTYKNHISTNWSSADTEWHVSREHQVGHTLSESPGVSPCKFSEPNNTNFPFGNNENMCVRESCSSSPPILGNVVDVKSRSHYFHNQYETKLKNHSLNSHSNSRLLYSGLGWKLNCAHLTENENLNSHNLSCDFCSNDFLLNDVCNEVGNIITLIEEGIKVSKIINVDKMISSLDSLKFMVGDIFSNLYSVNSVFSISSHSSLANDSYISQNCEFTNRGSGKDKINNFGAKTTLTNVLDSCKFVKCCKMPVITPNVTTSDKQPLLFIPSPGVSPTPGSEANGQDALTDVEYLASDIEITPRASPIPKIKKVAPDSEDEKATDEDSVEGSEDDIENKEIPPIDVDAFLTTPQEVLNFTEGYARIASPLLTDSEEYSKHDIGERHTKNIKRTQAKAKDSSLPEEPARNTDEENISDSGNELSDSSNDNENSTLPEYYFQDDRPISSHEAVKAISPIQEHEFGIKKSRKTTLEVHEEGAEGTTDVEEVSMGVSKGVSKSPIVRPKRKRAKRKKGNKLPEVSATLITPKENEDAVTDTEMLPGDETSDTSETSEDFEDALLVPRKDLEDFTDTEDVHASDIDEGDLITEPIPKKEYPDIPEAFAEQIRIKENDNDPTNEDNQVDTDEEGFQLDDRDDERPLIMPVVNYDMSADERDNRDTSEDEKEDENLTDLDDINMEEKEDEDIINDIIQRMPADDSNILLEMESHSDSVTNSKTDSVDPNAAARKDSSLGLNDNHVDALTDVEEWDDKGGVKKVKKVFQKPKIVKDSDTDTGSIEDSDDEVPQPKSRTKKRGKGSKRLPLVPQISDVRFIETSQGPLSIIITPDSINPDLKDDIKGVVFLETNESDDPTTDIEDVGMPLNVLVKEEITLPSNEAVDPMTDTEDFEGADPSLDQSDEAISCDTPALPSPKRERIRIVEDEFGVPHVKIENLPDHEIDIADETEQALTDLEDVEDSGDEVPVVAHFQESDGEASNILAEVGSTEVSTKTKNKKIRKHISAPLSTDHTDVEEITAGKKMKRKAKSKKPNLVVEDNDESGNTDVELLDESNASPKLVPVVEIDSGSNTDYENFEDSGPEETEPQILVCAPTPEIIRKSTVKRTIVYKEYPTGTFKTEDQEENQTARFLPLGQDPAGLTDVEEVEISEGEEAKEEVIIKDIPVSRFLDQEGSNVSVSMKSVIPHSKEAEEAEIKDNLLLPDNHGGHTEVESLDEGEETGDFDSTVRDDTHGPEETFLPPDVATMTLCQRDALYKSLQSFANSLAESIVNEVFNDIMANGIIKYKDDARLLEKSAFFPMERPFEGEGNVCVENWSSNDMRPADILEKPEGEKSYRSSH